MLNNYDDILTVDQLMELLYIGRNTAYKLLNSGKIKGFRVGNGKNWRIPKESVEEYVDECLKEHIKEIDLTAY